MGNPTRRSAERPYHHGDLRTALLGEAEAILERDGIQALTLRAAARAAGVSHAAPTNHFGDLTGLLSELAALGYARFAAMLRGSRAAASEPETRLRAMGEAYVAFARAYPGMFALMFRSERLDMTRPALHEAMIASRQALRDGIIGRMGEPSLPASPLRAAATATALWSLVHGFAMLLLDGRLQATIDALPAGAGIETLLREMLDIVRIDGAPPSA
jgi:AcrR family transcriptional regulator